MPSSPLPSPRLRHLAIAGVAALFVGLTGCTEPSDDPPAASPSASASASGSPSAEPSTPPSESPQAATPIEESCLDLVSLQTMYDFDPNFGLQDPFTPAAGSRGATALGYDGVACNWLQQTSGEDLEIDVAAPPATELSALKAGAGETSDGRSYFTAEGSTGIVQVFDGAYWIVLSSSYFLGASDAASLADSVTSALP